MLRQSTMNTKRVVGFIIGTGWFILNLNSLAQTSPATALSLNGAAGNYVQVSNNVPISGNFTVEGWVYARSFNSFSRLIDFANGPNNGNVYLALTAAATGNPVAGVFTNSGLPTLTATNTLPLGQWAHLALTLNGTNGTIYINGNIAGTGILNVAPNISRGSNYIGRSNYSPDGYANAAFQEIRIWNVARSQGDIISTMTRQLRGNESGLVAYWRCNQNSGTVLTNYSSAGSLYNGTLIGAATFTNSSAPINIQCTIGATNLFEAPGAGSDTVTLGVAPAGAPWTATANAAWLTATAPSGNGSTNVLFSFAANSGPTRAGTLTLSTSSTNFTVTVTQAGSNYVASPRPFTVLCDDPYAGGVAVDKSGNVYFGDSYEGLIKKWTLNTSASSVVLTGRAKPQGLAFDNAGNLYICEETNNVITRWTPSSGISPTNLSVANLNLPVGVSVDSSGNVFAVDRFSNLRQWTAGNQATTLLAASPSLANPTTSAQDAAGNVYVLSSGFARLSKWSADTGNVTTFFQGNFLEGVTVDGSGNVYTSQFDSGTFITSLMEWVAASNIWITVNTQVYSPDFITVDATGNIFVANGGTAQLVEIPKAFVDGTTHLEGADAGTDSLAPVVPATQNLRPPFQPISDSDWLTITGVTNGVVSFAFTSTTTNRTGNIYLLGQPIPVTQIAPLSPSTLFGATIPAKGSFQFSITNPGSPSSVVILTSTNVSLPLSNWTVLGTGVVVSPGLYQFTDSNATNSRQYYNVLSQ